MAQKTKGPTDGRAFLQVAWLLGSAAVVSLRSGAPGALVGRAGLIRPVAFLCRVALVLGRSADMMVPRGNDRVVRAGYARAGAVLGHVAVAGRGAALEGRRFEAVSRTAGGRPGAALRHIANASRSSTLDR